MRRALTALVAGATLWASQAFGGCPPMTPSQAALEARLEQGSPTNAGSAIDLSAGADLCPRQPKAVICAGHAGRRLPLLDVLRINAAFHAEFEYRSDIVRTGRPDFWEAGTTCGDCEDYALGLSERLAAAGADGASMALVASILPQGGHMTLLVYTADAGWFEISVGRGINAVPYTPKRWRRIAEMPMDGSRRIIVWDRRGYVGPKHL